MRQNITWRILEKFLNIFFPRNNLFPLPVNEEILAPVSPDSVFMIMKQSSIE